ncbi:MAG: 1-deoxy-D-xylulose-5-phosphate synthase [Desulfobacterales bacterium C00003104]|nr:MAG: 1-deoxy-D-xylulose-5-phosphate synthase [Desulfobacterales bacterium C00003104]
MKYLNKINSPRDLKKLDEAELPLLAQELRDVIVKTVSKTGGHLAPSLGVVELTIALHYVFDAPTDKIVWDVGHQAYAHKLLTGRRDSFHTIRQHGGLSGFPRISESPYDSFSTGHSSTSISAGLGMLCAKRIKKDRSKIISVIGDGSMTAGLAYEGLNQTGHIHKDMIVILNDNEMSISKNVGALSSFLSRKLSARHFMNLKREFGDFLKSLPRVGDDMYQLAKRTEDSFKSFLTPGILFEAFNFDYLGPIKGHRFDHLIPTLRNMQVMEEPVLLHVLTKKGKGYPPAEQNPTYFHGVGGFEISTGNCITSKKRIPTYTRVFGDTMVECAEKDEKIVAVTAAMPEGTGLAGFAERFPDRFFDVGIAEQHGVTFAAGMATQGFHPVVAVYSTFLQRAYDQIVHDVCLESLPVIFAVDRGGIVGDDGPTHQGAFDLSYLRSIPNMVLMAPKDENELRKMMRTAFDHDGPIAYRYPRACGLGVPLDSEIEPVPIGKGEVLAEGSDLIILAIGLTVSAAVVAANELSGKGISATVVNARFVKPLDSELILSLAEKIPNLITVEDNISCGGFGSAVLECLSNAGITGTNVVRLGLPDMFIEHGPQDLLRTKYGIDAAAIVNAAEKFIHS